MVVFIFFLLVYCALIFLSEYFIITLPDLECDYNNARSCCSTLNEWIIPESIGHTIVTVLMLISLNWFIFLLNLPVAIWNMYGSLWCQVVTWSVWYNRNTVEGSWSHTWKKPWSSLVSTCSVSSCIFIGESAVFLELFRMPCLLLLDEMLLYCRI